MSQLVHNRRYKFIAIIALLAIWAWHIFLRPQYGLKTKALVDLFPGSTQTTHSKPGIYQYKSFKASAIYNVCEATQWTPGLVFTCDESYGGVGNLRNSILHCVRYAIHAGASLVMPKIMLRTEFHLINQKVTDTGKIEFDYIFDRKHWDEALKEACPQLHVFEKVEEIPQIESALAVLKILPESLIKEEIPRTGLPHPEQWREIFYKWLHEHGTPNAAAPIIVNLDRSYITYPIHTDGAEFALNFGSILESRRDARLLASTVLYNMGNAYGFSCDQASQAITPNAFFGAHLRTEADAVNAWTVTDPMWVYGRFENQTAFYLAQAPRSKTSVIYVASGNNTEVDRFAAIVKISLDFPVITKFDLLQGKDLEALKAMSWDQQALVDFEVMMRATDFGGVSHSSFAWNIALRRHMYSKVKQYLDGPQMLSDELSQIYGVPRGYPEYDACMWP